MNLKIVSNLIHTPTGPFDISAFMGFS